jgi:hypothetical protein
MTIAILPKLSQEVHGPLSGVLHEWSFLGYEELLFFRVLDGIYVEIILKLAYLLRSSLL